MPPKSIPLPVASNRPCALVFSYYFAPSSEVAARRLAAIVSLLPTTQLDVLIVSKFGGADLSPGAQIQPRVFAIPVAEPPRLLLDGLVLIKRLLLRARPKRASVKVAAAAPLGSSTPSIAARLYEEFLAVLQALDAQKKWSYRAYRTALRATQSRDLRLVIASGPPFSSAIVAHWIARRSKAPYILDFRDPMAAGWDNEFKRPAWIAWIVERLERSIITAAAAVTCASPGIARMLRSAYPQQAYKIELVMNGFDGAIQPTPAATNHRLDIAFAGSLYLNRDPFPFLEALDSLLAEPGIDARRITARFIGDCESFGNRRLADWLRGRRCEAVVQLVPAMPAAELAPVLTTATVHLNLAQLQPNQIPAKTFEHLASGREVLVLCEPDSDTGRLLGSIPGALQVDPADEAALQAALRDLYRRHVVDGVSKSLPTQQVLQYSRAVQNERFAALIGNIVRL